MDKIKYVHIVSTNIIYILQKTEKQNKNRNCKFSYFCFLNKNTNTNIVFLNKIHFKIKTKINNIKNSLRLQKIYLFTIFR